MQSETTGPVSETQASPTLPHLQHKPGALAGWDTGALLCLPVLGLGSRVKGLKVCVTETGRR